MRGMPGRKAKATVAVVALAIVATGSVGLQAGGPVYPKSKRVEQVDDHHGVKVADPYRWLEDDVRVSKEVADWVASQNKVTFGYLHAIPQRPAIINRLTELWNYEKFSAPFKAGGRYYYYRNDGLQNQNVLYVQDRLDAPARVLIDPNTWSKDGTVALAAVDFSDDGRYLAYGVAEAGSDWRTWRVLNIESGKLLEDEIRWEKFSSAAWTADSRGFFYCRFPEPAKGEKFQKLNLNQKVYYHRLGTNQADDVLVYHRPDHPDWGFQPQVTEDGRYLVLTVWKGTDDKYRIVVKDLNEPYGLPTELISHFDDEYTLVGNDGPVFLFKTDRQAPKKKVIAIDLRRPAPENWKVILPEEPDPLVGVNLVGNQLLAIRLKDASTVVKAHGMDGAFLREITLPGIGSAGGFGGKRIDSETFYMFSSFATPPSIYRLDLNTGVSTSLRKAQVKFNPDDYIVERSFYKSKDGTKIPIFVTHRKGIKLDGSNPTLLYGYGGFNIPMTPSFAITRAAWLEMGGVYAVACIRGGGEYGEEWHKAGTKQQKQNVFDDFLAGAEWLIEQKITSASKLAIKGGSNGGLLVGACMTQRPDLFGACLPAVGVMDMLRFHKFTAGRFWVDDYGSADNSAEFHAIYKYSPYHNLKPGTKYPPTLVTTADTDDRVVPGHSFKFAAQLQNCHQGDSPVLIRIETKAGHGAGKPTAKLIEETADEFSFLVKNLDFSPANTK